MKNPEFLGEYYKINSPADLNSLPNEFYFAETFQRDVAPGHPIGLLVTKDVKVRKIEVRGDAITLSVGPMVFMIHSNEFNYPFEVKEG